MKTNPTIYRHYNAVLKLALTAINQYFLHARMLGNWGFKNLAAEEHAASLRAMRHADRVIERVLFLEGLPNFEEAGRIMIGENVPEIMRNDLTVERAYRDALAAAIHRCEGEKDYVSRHRLEELQQDSEERINWLETQLALIASLGLKNYLGSVM
jgi:bacterioferritin